MSQSVVDPPRSSGPPAAPPSEVAHTPAWVHVTRWGLIVLTILGLGYAAQQAIEAGSWLIVIVAAFIAMAVLVVYSTRRAIPAKYLENLLADLRRARLIASQRGLGGGYRLARPATAITLADIIRAIDGPLTGVRDDAPEDVAYPGAAASLREVWIALRASMRGVLEATSLADVATGKLPAPVRKLLRDPEAWTRR